MTHLLWCFARSHRACVAFRAGIGLGKVFKGGGTQAVVRMINMAKDPDAK